MTLLYTTGIYLYGLGIRLAALFSPKASKWVKGRRNLIAEISAISDPKVQKIWMHCPSLGEFEQGRPVLEALRTKFPEYPLVLTFFSPSGFEAKHDYPGVDYVFYLPEDTPGNAQAFVEAVNPKLALFVKYDFWLNFLNALNARQCTTLLVSGIFRPNQHFFGRFSQLGKTMLKRFAHLFVQNEESVHLLQNIGFKNITLSGDTRLDRVNKLAEMAEPVPIIADFCGVHFTIVAGSTWPADENLLFPIINSGADMKWIIAPHEISAAHIASIESRLSVKSVRYSNAQQCESPHAKVMIIDNIGLLSRIYQYGKVAYIGGGFGKSIHNILEAAAWGVPVIFGPRHEKFEEARTLIAQGGAFSVNNTDETKFHIRRMESDKQELALAQSAARNYVLENAGATKIITEWISDLLHDQ